MADSIVRLKVEDDSFNAKIKEAAKAFADFGKRVASAGVEAMGDFAKGAATAKTAFEGFNAALKANALVLVASLAVQAASAIGEMIGLPYRHPRGGKHLHHGPGPDPAERSPHRRRRQSH